MKNMKNMISHFRSSPYLEKKFYEFDSISLFKEKIPLSLSKFIDNVYIKNHILFIITAHSGFTMELNHKKDEMMFVIELLKTHKKKLLNITEIKIFHKNIIKTQENIKKVDLKKLEFTELSKATFINHLDDIELQGSMEKIRDIIKSRIQ